MDKATVISIIESGMTVLDGDHIHAAARFWLAREIKAGRVVRFWCEMTGAQRLAAADKALI